jgi:uncharacterized protein YndB with AHSA1/START domain
MNDFSTSTTIDRSPTEVFAAILNTRSWWNSTIDGPTAHSGDEFGFEVEGLHRTRIRITDLTPNQRVEWLVLDNEFGFTSNQSEWMGDRIVFELQPIDAGTKVTFTQHGLTTAQECYDVCSNAWTFFIGDSLRLLAEHGQGKPESNTGQAQPADRARAAADALDQRPAPRPSCEPTAGRSSATLCAIKGCVSRVSKILLTCNHQLRESRRITWSTEASSASSRSTRTPRWSTR